MTLHLIKHEAVIGETRYRSDQYGCISIYTRNSAGVELWMYFGELRGRSIKRAVAEINAFNGKFSQEAEKYARAMGL